MKGDRQAPVITVDGPSGSGKGTLAQRLAHFLGWHYLDSGALYRILALAARERRIPLDDPPRLAALAQAINVCFALAPAGTARVLLEGLDVSDIIRGEECGNAASKLATAPLVRSALLEQQRAFCRAPGLVTDGRDMGTIVFPGAMLKIFLTASPRQRARRRYKQLKEKGIDANLEDLEKEIAERDLRDRMRRVAPLKPADHARMLDSTELDADEVFQQALAWLPDKVRNEGSSRW